MKIDIHTNITISPEDDDNVTIDQIEAIKAEHRRLRTILGDELKQYAVDLLKPTDTDDAFERGRII